MTKQDFLAMSQGKGLKLISDTGAIFEFNGLVDDVIYLFNKIYCNEKPNYIRTGFGNIKAKSFSIVARPLSDLTKEIEHCGEKFVPTVKLGWNTVNLAFSASNIKMAIDTLTLHEAQKLIEWKFNLMDENEPFIDVNTLEVNPYK